ncbi:MAG: hypothetical protein U5L09_07855 [Bacteroidales bacterium]|nr:hypothetical protein [Bacteroidales bacterium]
MSTELVDKEKCASKGMYYHSLKLHALAFWQDNKLPFPSNSLLHLLLLMILHFLKMLGAIWRTDVFMGIKFMKIKTIFSAS